LPPIHLKSLADLDNAVEMPMIETSMAELKTLGNAGDCRQGG